MPNHAYTFWVHGITALPEHDVQGMRVIRSGGRCQIRQPEGTWNWIQIPLPGATMLDDESVHLQHAWLRYSINLNAHISRIDVRESPGPNGQYTRAIYSRSEQLSGIGESDPASQYSAVLKDHIATGPIVMSVKVNFHDGGGELSLVGAGVQYLE